MILFADLFKRTAIADIGRLIQIRAGNCLIILAVFSAVPGFTEFAPAEAAVFCFVWADIFMQAL